MVPWETCKFLYNHQKVSYVMEHLLSINQEASALVQTLFSVYAYDDVVFARAVLDQVNSNFALLLQSNQDKHLIIYREVLTDQVKLLRLLLKQCVSLPFDHSAFLQVLV